MIKKWFNNLDVNTQHIITEKVWPKVYWTLFAVCVFLGTGLLGAMGSGAALLQ